MSQHMLTLDIKSSVVLLLLSSITKHCLSPDCDVDIKKNGYSICVHVCITVFIVKGLFLRIEKGVQYGLDIDVFNRDSWTTISYFQTCMPDCLYLLPMLP